jgi:hypothetical protein
MTSRSLLFFAAFLVCGSACTPSATPAPSAAETPPITPTVGDHDAASKPEGGSLPDFSSSSDVADAGQAARDDEAEATENPPSAAVPAGVDADDVREAVFRHMMVNNASGQQKSAGVYCLEVEGQSDPTPGFLARMKDLKKRIVAVSGCSASAEHGVVDKKTHAQGLIFRIESVSFKDARHATVNGGYYEAGLSASGNIYTLERKANGWVVTKDQMTWIS